MTPIVFRIRAKLFQVVYKALEGVAHLSSAATPLLQPTATSGLQNYRYFLIPPNSLLPPLPPAFYTFILSFRSQSHHPVLLEVFPNISPFFPHIVGIVTTYGIIL